MPLSHFSLLYMKTPIRISKFYPLEKFLLVKVLKVIADDKFIELFCDVVDFHLELFLKLCFQDYNDAVYLPTSAFEQFIFIFLPVSYLSYKYHLLR
jgi:hypothetical protein